MTSLRYHATGICPLDDDLDVLVCWLGDAPIAPGARYLLQHTTRTVRVAVAEIARRLDINAHALDPSAAALGPNDVGRVRPRLPEPIFPDAYRVNRATGAAILIDEGTNATVGAVLVTADGDDLP